MMPPALHFAELARNRGRRSRGEAGALLVELVLVTPFILMLLGFVMRITHMLQAHQIAMSLSRELATEIFIKCADISLQDKTASNSSGDEQILVDTINSERAIAACLDRTKSNFLSNWQTGLRPTGALDGDPDLTLWVYRDNFSSLLPCSPPVCNCSSPKGYQTIKISQGTATSTQPDPDASLICKRNRVVRVYLHFKLRPLDAFLSLIGGINSGSFSSDQDVVEETVI